MGHETTAFTYYASVKNQEELNQFIQENAGALPDCEMFAELSPEDEELADSLGGYIAEEPTDQELIDEIPRTLKEALGLPRTLEELVKTLHYRQQHLEEALLLPEWL